MVRNPKFCGPGSWINYFDLRFDKDFYLIQIDSFVGMQIISRKYRASIKPSSFEKMTRDARS